MTRKYVWGRRLLLAATLALSTLALAGPAWAKYIW